MLRSLGWVGDAIEGQLLAADRDTKSDSAALDLALVVTDSREAQPGSTYVARIGETADGHDYCQSAVDRGAVALIVERPVELSGPLVPQIVVPDATVALGQLAKAHLAQLRQEGPIEVVGITGSAGKTTTKDLLAAVLSQQGPTVSPKLSFNNEVGCPITILKADDDTRFLVLEMGASAVGELAYLARIAPLDVAVELMVGRAHLGGFGGVRELARAKAELVQGLLPGGAAVLNYDDPNVREMQSAAPGRVLFFSATDAANADIRASDIEMGEGGCASFTAATGKGQSEQKARVTLGLVGAHQVANALAVLAAAGALGIGLEDAAASLSGVGAASPHRMDVRRIEVDTAGGPVCVTLVDDSYNANPDSMKASFREARRLAGADGRLVMVLGEMLELGPDTDAIHAEVGADALAAAPDALILIGGASAYLPRERLDGSMEDVAGTASFAEDADEASRLLTDALRDGDTILVKGSNGSQAWRIADRLTETQKVGQEANAA